VELCASIEMDHLGEEMALGVCQEAFGVLMVVDRIPDVATLFGANLSDTC
jgi:hypothetical protein